jgi:hypothetical protein
MICTNHKENKSNASVCFKGSAYMNTQHAIKKREGKKQLCGFKIIVENIRTSVDEETPKGFLK